MVWQQTKINMKSVLKLAGIVWVNREVLEIYFNEQSHHGQVAGLVGASHTPKVLVPSPLPSFLIL